MFLDLYSDIVYVIKLRMETVTSRDQDKYLLIMILLFLSSVDGIILFLSVMELFRKKNLTSMNDVGEVFGMNKLF